MTGALGWRTAIAAVVVAMVPAVYLSELRASPDAPVADVTTDAPVGSAQPPSAEPTPGAVTVDVLASMATLAGVPPVAADLDSWANKLAAGEPLAAYVDALLQNPRFSREIVPSLLFGSFVNVRNYYALPSGFVLKRVGPSLYYLRAPCPLETAIKVHPWWDLASEVKVCPDSYRPEKWTMSTSEHPYRSTMPLSCDSQVGSPELETRPLCGCGPNLIRCLRDEDQFQRFNRSLMDEVKLTTAYVVEHDLPIKTLFTGNHTFRDANVQLYYLRQKIGALEIAKPDAEIAALGVFGGSAPPPMPPKAANKPKIANKTPPVSWAQPQWAPREELKPGQHAGVLTSAQVLHWLPDRRQRQRGYYEILWCTLRNSFGATTSKVLELNASPNVAFVHDTWQRLAKTEVCTNCHARLDYGFQFMNGYPDSRASTHFNPALQSTATGPLYGHDIDDPRGTGQLTPVGFAELATAQPEFQSCMASHVLDYVLGGTATSDDRQAVESELQKTGSFKRAMRIALTRYGETWSRKAAPLPPATGAPSPPADLLSAMGVVSIAAPLRDKLEQHCLECHDQVPFSQAQDRPTEPIDFRPPLLPRSVVVSMVDHVAYGMMPKDSPLPALEREELVQMLIASLWSDPDARGEAQRYYALRRRGLPAQQLDNALFMIGDLAQAPSGLVWGALERGIWTDQSTVTPGFLATTGLEALRACMVARDQRGVKLDECLSRALPMRALSRSPVPR